MRISPICWPRWKGETERRTAIEIILYTKIAVTSLDDPLANSKPHPFLFRREERPEQLRQLLLGKAWIYLQLNVSIPKLGILTVI
jgi:hypothetical protein